MLSKRLIEVFTELIPVYEEAIQEVTEENWGSYLWDEGLSSGICLAAHCILQEEIGEEMKSLTNKFVPGTFYWYDTPSHVYELEEVKHCLQWRVNKMKELLNQ